MVQIFAPPIAVHPRGQKWGPCPHKVGLPMRTKTYDAAATETAAYDVLAMLMRLNGARPVLDILRYWYVISSLTGKRKTMPRP